MCSKPYPIGRPSYIFTEPGRKLYITKRQLRAPIPRGLFSRAREFSNSGLSFCSSIRAVPASDSPNGVLGQCLDRIARRLESTGRAVQIFLVDCRPPAYRPGTPGKASGLQYSLAIILVGFNKVFPVCLSIDCWRLSRSRSPGFTPR